MSINQIKFSSLINSAEIDPIIDPSASSMIPSDDKTSLDRAIEREGKEPRTIRNWDGTLFAPEIRNQQTLQDVVLAAFASNRVLARSILTGDNIKTMEKHIWFDLDQTPIVYSFLG